MKIANRLVRPVARARAMLLHATTILALWGTIATTEAAGIDATSQWAQWRGPLLTGAAPSADPPLNWSETENVRWKVKVPGFGTSTPILWEDRVFLSTAIPTGKKAQAAAPAAANNDSDRKGPPGKKADGTVYQFALLCLDRASGKVLWQKTAREEAPHEGHHPDHGYASASPVTDGKVVLAYFGSRGLHCFDLAGTLKWSKDFGRMQTRNSFGEGASPALHGATVVVCWDDESDNDFIAAFDKETGKELWRKPRNEPTGWSTPLVVEHGGKAEVVVNATGNVRSYALSSGEELWNCPGQTANAIPTPVAANGVVYVTSGFRGSALYAIALGQSGNLSGSGAILWQRQKNTPYVPSPLLVDDLLYLVTGNNGVLSCLDAKTGTAHFEGQRLEGIGGIYASPVTAKDRVYVLGRDGNCLVLKKGPKFEVLARNKLDDRTDASIALVDREIFIRGHQGVYCIAESR